jgi:hypothetical protein
MQNVSFASEVLSNPLIFVKFDNVVDFPAFVQPFTSNSKWDFESLEKYSLKKLYNVFWSNVGNLLSSLVRLNYSMHFKAHYSYSFVNSKGNSRP